MKLEASQIFKEYKDGMRFKASLGTRGMYEQNKINERFFAGDQWHGAKCGNDRPLVRHNIIKRIGDYKMAKVLSEPITVKFSADGVPNTVGLRDGLNIRKKELSSGENISFKGNAGNDEINLVMSALENYRKITAERLGFDSICEQALKNAYISGGSVIYTYWNPEIKTGLYADDSRTVPINGDIACEVLDIENVYFADPYCESVQNQPYIIIASYCEKEALIREADKYGSGAHVLKNLKADSDGKILVLTKLFKEYDEFGNFKIKCIKVTENCVVRPQFDTRLRLYPLTVFNWENRNNMIYGESEVTYLIPNQIAINRMITAKVWASMTMGMPIMVVNGDIVTDSITNDPGQIIKIYGTNEDVAGAVKYVTPPDFSANFDESINDLIENTLTQSGANEAARGDSTPDNATAIIALQNVSVLPLRLISRRFYNAIEDISRIWADFWITQYGDRKIKIEDENGVWYMPFKAQRYKDLMISTNVKVKGENIYSTEQQISVLSDLYDKGIIGKKQYLKRLPDGIVQEINELLEEVKEDVKEEENG